MGDERCKVCDRAECLVAKTCKAYRDARQVAVDRAKAGESEESIDAATEISHALYLAIDDVGRDCDAHRVDWRARAQAAESRVAEVEREREDRAESAAHWMAEEHRRTKERDAARATLSKLAVTLGLTDHEWSASSPEQVLARAEGVVRERDEAVGHRAATNAEIKTLHAIIKSKGFCVEDSVALHTARADVTHLTSEAAALRAEVERLKPIVERVAEADIDDRLGAVKIYERPGRPHPEYTAEWLPDAARHALGLPEREEQS